MPLPLFGAEGIGSNEDVVVATASLILKRWAKMSAAISPVASSISSMVRALTTSPLAQGLPANAGSSLLTWTEYQPVFDRRKHGKGPAFVGDEMIVGTSQETCSSVTVSIQTPLAVVHGHSDYIIKRRSPRIGVLLSPYPNLIFIHHPKFSNQWLRFEQGQDFVKSVQHIGFVLAFHP